MHVRNIEPVAITPPYFIEDLVPFLRWNPVDKKSPGRNRLLRLVSLRSGVIEVVAGTLRHQQLRSVVGKRIAADVFGNRRLLTIFESKNLEHRWAIAGAAIIER